jgi:hypothetical protein
MAALDLRRQDCACRTSGQVLGAPAAKTTEELRSSRNVRARSLEWRPPLDQALTSVADADDKPLTCMNTTA